MMKASSPIGIFDSGIGGLSIARAIEKVLPNEKIIYFGDTEHFPYGEKSSIEIQEYSMKIAQWLSLQQCKMIVIACHSASSAATALLTKLFGQHLFIVDAIEPLISHLANHHPHKRMGIIGTTQTIQSQVYQRKIANLELGIQVAALPTPLLASAIEHHMEQSTIKTLLTEYLSHESLTDIDALILACTHYPLIMQEFAEYYTNNITLIDPGQLIAETVKKILTQHELLNTETFDIDTAALRDKYYLSHHSHSFAQSAQHLFKEIIPFEMHRPHEEDVM